jgi:DNA-binding NarL/FixJ family response regulator
MNDNASELAAAYADMQSAALRFRDAVVRNLAANGLQSKQIAEQLGVTRQRIEQILRAP